MTRHLCIDRGPRSAVTHPARKPTIAAPWSVSCCSCSCYMQEPPYDQGRARSTNPDSHIALTPPLPTGVLRHPVPPAC
ncbi:hypothetical protein L227DRAFT_75770 [Lentinus tigrinus ALCF2SS1-6]|uniref:Uncharacterized protein n=1 Tax=Lentinus tigrinus ALCF2SS1-6 TaxID=1328759 RepID=A0A5C2SD87_9APHY|nr:hypothetical protein L227DRAFT_75770 [Lentinus tigrinus ALCF2SS1-6]